MSEELKNAALAFCRDCLDWGDAEPGYANGVDEIAQDHISSLVWDALLPYQDLNAVLHRVRIWSDSDQKLRLELTDFGVAASIWLNDEMLSEARFQSCDPDAICLAVFQACVEAERKMREWDAKAASKTTARV